MNNKKLQDYLKQFPDEMEIKCLRNMMSDDGSKYNLTEENIIIYTDTAYIDSDAPEEEHDTEEGKLQLGTGERFLLFNTPVL